MLLLSLGLLSVGYTLAYAGVRGVYWDAPWKLWFGGAGGPGGPSVVSGLPGGGVGVHIGPGSEALPGTSPGGGLVVGN